MATNIGFLSVAFATLRHLFAVRFDDLFDDDLFDDFFGDDLYLGGDVAVLKDISGFFIVFDQCCGQWLGQF